MGGKERERDGWTMRGGWREKRQGEEGGKGKKEKERKGNRERRKKREGGGGRSIETLTMTFTALTL